MAAPFTIDVADTAPPGGMSPDLDWYREGVRDDLWSAHNTQPLRGLSESTVWPSTEEADAAVAAVAELSLPPIPTGTAIDRGSPPALIPAHPAWVLGGVSMAVFGPVLSSRRLRRRLLR